MVGMTIPVGKGGGNSSRQHEYYIEQDDEEEVRPEEDDDADPETTPLSSPSNSPKGRPETPMAHHWPQSYRCAKLQKADVILIVDMKGCSWFDGYCFESQLMHRVTFDVMFSVDVLQIF